MDDLFNLIKDQFRLSLNSTHGVLHWKSVEDIGVYLAKFTGADVPVVRHFAYLHDSQRFFEGEDPLHALRAGDFVQDICDKGILDLTMSQSLLLKKACQVHNTSPAIPLDQTIATCLDADRLDLLRLGVNPSSKLLFTATAKRISENIAKHNSNTQTREIVHRYIASLDYRQTCQG